jgi:Na+/H+-dicarboxylate symporter
MLQVVFVALLVGVGLVRAPPGSGRVVKDFFAGLADVVIRLVDLIMLAAPVGVFALIAGTITTVAGDDPARIWYLLRSLGTYILVVVSGLALHALVAYPAILRLFTPMSIRRFFREIAPAQLFAFSSSSSGATLPVTMERVRDGLGVSDKVTSFVVPLGATINMDGTALYQAVAATFIAQALGMDLTITQQLTVVLTAVLASIGTAAVPGVGIVMLVIILEAIGVPAAGIALILGVDRPLDMLRTAVNVTGDAAVATVVAASEGELGSP